MMIECHFAWFSRSGGHWLAEWRGLVPAPAIDPSLVGDDRVRLLNAWQQDMQSRILAGDVAGDGLCDGDAWDACGTGDAVCLDVSRFAWPLGDHRYHVWNDTTRSLDWPASSIRKYIEVTCENLEVIANVESHRPLVSSVPGQLVIDITGSPLAEHHGHIWGRFVWLADRWSFLPRRRGHPGQRIVPGATRRALAAAPIDFLGEQFHAVRERVAAR